LLANSVADLKALVAGGPFQRVWIFDFAKKQVLWRASTEAATFPPGNARFGGGMKPNMAIDMSNMEEICCPDCKKPLLAVHNPDSPDFYRFQGCPCGRKEYTLPKCVMFGIGGGPLFFYKEKSLGPNVQP
jgi:hypothetical protein